MWRLRFVSCRAIGVIGALLMALQTMVAGCVAVRVAMIASPDAFEQNRAATVRIIMSKEDWEGYVRSATDNEYVHADFCRDAELVPDVGVRPKATLRSVPLSGPRALGSH